MSKDEYDENESVMQDAVVKALVPDQCNQG